MMDGSTEPSIVMGLSGKVNEWVDLDLAKQRNLQILRRFSGGGTVFVDNQTLFVSWIIDTKEQPIQPFPEPILHWAEKIYQQTLKHPDFSLRENDFAIGEKKVAGNAFYLTKHRWLLHSSFLYDCVMENMDVLVPPPRMPSYREHRPHKEFLTTLREHKIPKEKFFRALKEAIDQIATTKIENIDSIHPLLKKTYRKSLNALPF